MAAPFQGIEELKRPLLLRCLLGLLLALFLAYVFRLRPVERFGQYHDDAVYFSSAQALADGQGYVLPSLPGSPRQTKYPVLYPWLLAGVWKWRPSFPGNLGAAVALTAAFGGVFLVLAFELLRRLEGIGGWTALGLTALCAFHPNVLILSGAVLSDMPFAALALAAALAGDGALRRDAPPWRAAAAGALAGLSLLSRSLGIAVLAGLVAAALVRRLGGRALAVLAGAAPFVAGAVAAAAGTPELPAWARGGARQTWLFYTSYWEFWKLSVPTWDVFLNMAGSNLRYLAEAPATFCLFPPLGDGRSYAGILLCVTLTAGILSGVVRQARRQEWKPVHLMLGFYAAAVLLWNYAILDRFLVVFLPLFYAGLWVEGGHVFGMLRTAMRAGRPVSEKVIGGLLSLGLVLLAVQAARFYLGGTRDGIQRSAARRAALAREKQQAYDWIREHTEPQERLVAYEDVPLSLYTGRQAMRPIVFSTEAFYQKDEAVLKHDLARITDTARGMGARYWVMAADDFELETGLPLIEARMAEVKEVLPVAFRSSGDKVRVYDLTCLQEPEGLGCRAAAAVLFGHEMVESRSASVIP